MANSDIAHFCGPETKQYEKEKKEIIKKYSCANELQCPEDLFLEWELLSLNV